MLKEAYFYNYEGDKIRCVLCPHKCLISQNQSGLCKVRKALKDEDENLKLFTINYGEITSIALDPIEKKPLYKFLPGSNILSIGSYGCNFTCSFCQNYQISQNVVDSKFVPVKHLCNLALDMDNSVGIAFTYNEPTVWYEYAIDVAKNIKSIDSSHKIVLVSNGYINEEPLKELLPYVDAMNIDLKGNEDYYKKLCFGNLDSVKSTIKTAHKYGCHVEVTTLLVPGENTDDETIIDLASFLGNLDENIPIHISRYFPRYKMNKEATNLEDIKKAYKIIKSYLNNVYLGNLSEEEKTYCMS